MVYRKNVKIIIFMISSRSSGWLHLFPSSSLPALHSSSFTIHTHVQVENRKGRCYNCMWNLDSCFSFTERLEQVTENTGRYFKRYGAMDVPFLESFSYNMAIGLQFNYYLIKFSIHYEYFIDTFLKYFSFNTKIYTLKGSFTLWASIFLR